MKIRKRNGQEQDFDENKIRNAINKANKSVDEKSQLDEEKIEKVVETTLKFLKGYSTVDVETIQDFVEKALMKHNCYDVAKAYVLYRDTHKRNKKFTEDEEKIISICNATNEDVSGDNANKKPTVLGTMRDYIAGTMCKTIGRKTLTKEIVEAHDSGLIHFHDMDYSPAMPMSNCCLVNVFDMFKNGFQMGDTHIDPPKSFATGCNLMAQINLIVSGQQYGGQTVSWAALAPLVDVSRQKIRKEVIEDLTETGLINSISKQKINSIIEKRLRKEIKDGVQTYQYQVICHTSSNGQSPFVSVVLALREARTEQEQKDLAMILEEVLNQRIIGIKNEDGIYTAPLFPKLLYVVSDGLNAKEGDPYWYLTKLAAKCITKRMQPDIISEKKSREAKNGMLIPCMGCRSFLTPYWHEVEYTIDNELNYEELDKADPDYICYSLKPKSLKKIEDGDYEKGKLPYNFIGNTGWILSKHDGKIKCLEPKAYGRWNRGVVTLNIPFTAMRSKVEDKDFWEELDHDCEIIHKALIARNNSIKKIKAKNAPILWMYGGLSRLNGENDLSSMLNDVDYTTISFGYIGLYETCMALIGKSNTTPEGIVLSKKILTFLNDKCSEWKEIDKIPYSIYGTPEESLTEKASNALKKNFGTGIYGVTDHDYVTNSYHVNPAEHISAFDKLALEGEYLALSKGGAVSYIETTNMQNNPEAIEAVIKFMYDNILYAEVNTKIDYCSECGYQGELVLDDSHDGKLMFHCPKCGCTDQTKLSAIRRMCGYMGEAAHGISSNSPNCNQSRLADIHARYVHLQ